MSPLIFPQGRDIEDTEPDEIMQKRLNRTGVALRIMCAMALLFLGLSHKMPAVAEVPSATIAYAQAYALPDGTAPDLCVPSDHGKMRLSVPDCDACRLSGSVLLPEPPALAAYRLEPVETVFPLPVQAAVAAAISRSQTARGPPDSVLS